MTTSVEAARDLNRPLGPAGEPDRVGAVEDITPDGGARPIVARAYIPTQPTMSGPMTGIKVVEVGFWVAGPSAAGILADWGAEVVKIEPPDGDPMRGVLSLANLSVNPPFELDNRGKRSICLNLASERGKEIAHVLVDGADVFITNLRAAALARRGLDYEASIARNPRLVYASVTGYGGAGPDANRPTYDIGAFWARAGIAHALTPVGQAPPMQRGGMGDHMAGMAIAGGVAAALLARERSGRGQRVETSLLRIGGYMLGWDLNVHLRTGLPTIPSVRRAVPNPMINCYEAADGRWFWLLGLQSDRHWPDVVRAVERPDLHGDARFGSHAARMQHAMELVNILDSIFAERPLADWAEAFDGEGVWWAPVQSVDDLATDPQAASAGLFVDVPSDGAAVRMVASPVDFSDTTWDPAGMAPEAGQHTEDILLELGLGWDDIAALADSGVIP